MTAVALDRRQLNKALLAVFGAVSTTSLLGACADEGSTTSAGLDIVKWGYFRNYQPVYVGVAAGLFEAEGIEVDLTGAFQSGSEVVQAAASGQIDAGHSAIPGIAGAVAAGFELAGVADSQTEFVEAPLQQWFVRDDSELRGIEDLQGATIGTNALTGSFYSTAVIALEKAGMTVDDVNFVTLAHDKQGQALRAGQIDVAGVIDPYSVELSQDVGLRRLFTGAEVLGERQFSLIFFTSAFMEERPEAAEAFMRGYRASIDFISEQPDEANRLMAEALGIDSSLVVAHQYTADAEVRTRDVEFWIDQLRAEGELDDADSLRAEDIIDLRFQGDA